MNAKLVKAARRLARQFSVGMPERQLLGQARKVKRLRKGKSIHYEAQQAINDPRSTRGVYRVIKRALRKCISLEALAVQDVGVAA